MIDMRTATEIRAALASLTFDYIREGRTMPPWVVDEWIVGTDGWLMVAFRKTLVEGEATAVPDDYLKHVRDWLKAESTMPPFAVSAAWLMKVSGCDELIVDCAACKNTGVVTCDECDGDGEMTCECRACGNEHSADCSNCDNGKMDCQSCERTTKAKPVSFLTARVDARRFVTALRVVQPDQHEMLMISLQRKGDSAAYILRPASHDNWRVVLMGMRDNTPTVATFALPQVEDAGAAPVGEGVTESA